MLFLHVGLDSLQNLIILMQTVRSFTFPDHKIQYNGQSAYRTVLSASLVREALGEAMTKIPNASAFWQNLGAKYLFTCPLGNDDYEFTARIARPPKGQEHVSWGRPFKLGALVHEYDEFYEPVRRVLQVVADKGETQEFALFGGPRLERVVAWDAVALIGDASHPLSGAFGAGAGFALEDVYTLYKTLEWAWGRGEELTVALEQFNQIRSTHYNALYDTLDWYGAVGKQIASEGLTVDREIEERVLRTTSGEKAGWMYGYDIQEVVGDFLAKQDVQTK